MRTTVTILTLLLFASFSGRLSACSCIGQKTVKDSFKGSKLIIVGQILSKEIVLAYDTLNLDRKQLYQLKESPMFTVKAASYKVLVLKKFKGKVNSDTITIITGVGSGDCGYNFVVGQNYIIYGANKKEIGYGKTKKLPLNTFTTNICTRTMIYNDEEIAEIKKVIK